VIFCNVKNKVNFWQLKEPIRDISSLFCEQMTKLVKEETLVPTTKLIWLNKTHLILRTKLTLHLQVVARY
jgi:hypothetical protein